MDTVQGVFNWGRCKGIEYSRWKVFRNGYLLGPSDEAFALPKSNSREYWNSFLVMYQSFPNHSFHRAYPGDLLGTVGNFTKMRPTQSGIWLWCQNAGQRRRQKDSVIVAAFSMTVHRVHGRVIAPIFTVLLEHFVNLWQSQLNVGFLERTILLKWINRRTTAFRDFT